MHLLSLSRRGTWLLAGAVWCAACAGLWWMAPVVPRIATPLAPGAEVLGFSVPFGTAIVKRELPDRVGSELRYALALVDLGTGTSVQQLAPTSTVTREPHVIGASSDGRIWVLDVSIQSKHRLHKFDLQTRSISELKTPERSEEDGCVCELSPDGQYLAMAATDSTSLVLWNVAEDRLGGMVADCAAPYAFSADSRRVLGLGSSDRVCIVDTKSLSKVAELRLPQFHEVGSWSQPSVSLSTHADYAAAYLGKGWAHSETGDFESVVICWDVKTGNEILRVPLTPQTLGVSGAFHIVGVRFSADDASLVVVSDFWHPDFHCLDLKTRRPIIGDFTTKVASRDLSPDGRVIVECPESESSALTEFLQRLGLNWFSSENTRYRFYDSATGRRLSSDLVIGDDEHAANLNDIPFKFWSADGTNVMTTNWPQNDELRIYDIPPRKSLTWFATGAALLALPIALLAWRRTRRLRAA